jgi:hypothetical protein
MSGHSTPPSQEQRQPNRINRANSSLNSHQLRRSTFLENLGNQLRLPLVTSFTPPYVSYEHTCGTEVAAKISPPT